VEYRSTELMESSHDYNPPEIRVDSFREPIVRYSLCM
jgi:hypothetical protein